MYWENGEIFTSNTFFFSSFYFTQHTIIIFPNDSTLFLYTCMGLNSIHNIILPYDSLHYDCRNWSKTHTKVLGCRFIVLKSLKRRCDTTIVWMRKDRENGKFSFIWCNLKQTGRHWLHCSRFECQTYILHLYSKCGSNFSLFICLRKHKLVNIHGNIE